jgi:hypothetical protein
MHSVTAAVKTFVLFVGCALKSTVLKHVLFGQIRINSRFHLRAFETE